MTECMVSSPSHRRLVEMVENVEIKCGLSESEVSCISRLYSNTLSNVRYVLSLSSLLVTEPASLCILCYPAYSGIIPRITPTARRFYPPVAVCREQIRRGLAYAAAAAAAASARWRRIVSVFRARASGQAGGFHIRSSQASSCSASSSALVVVIE